MDISMLGASIEELLQATGLSEEELIEKICAENRKKMAVADPREVRANFRKSYMGLNSEVTAEYIMTCIFPAIEASMKSGIFSDREEALKIILDTIRIECRMAMATLSYKMEHPDIESPSDVDQLAIELRYKEMFGITQSEEVNA